ncbi:MAG: hypothetical protein MUO24_11890 [Desulfobacterales bacterium]|nr:hypothetical protein [Desulfobacterales bacterium]
MNSALQTYLDSHPQVRDAITWDGVPYVNWQLCAPTQNFSVRLDQFYTILSSGQPLELSFNPAVVPPLSGDYMQPQDASEIFLAHIAFSLWVEISRHVRWHLHDNSSQSLSLILDSRNMFTPGTQANNAVGFYTINADMSGVGFPGNPTASYQFLTGSNPSIRSGPSFIKATARDTIWKVFRWIRDNLLHGTMGLTPAHQQAAYGCQSYQPIQTIFTRTIDPGSPALGPRFFSYYGCHSSAALVVWLLRVINIPAQSYDTYIEDSQNPLHAGIDLPTEYLFDAHMDNFYAEPPTLDPTIEPWELFNAPKSLHSAPPPLYPPLSDFARHLNHGVNFYIEPKFMEIVRTYRTIRQYYTSKNKYTAAPAAAEQRAKGYEKLEATKALAHPTYYFVNAYWAYLIYNTMIFENTLENNGFDASEVATVTATYAAKMQAVIDAFKQKNPGLSDTECLNAYTAAYNAWFNMRGA